MPSEKVYSNEEIEIVNKAIAVPDEPILLANGRRLELVKWVPVVEAGAAVRVSIEAVVCMDKQPIAFIGAANGTA